MKLLIVKSAHDASASLPNLVTNATTETINGTDCIYGDISNANWGGVKASFNSNDYSEGVLLPESVRK